MSMGFTTPALLAGLAGVVIPLVVHLLRRRRPRPTPFPGLVLLLAADKRAARRRRLRELLLLLTRMALLAAVALTLAGPHCSHTVEVPQSASRDQAAVIVVDDTLSMQYRLGGRTLFSEARARVLALLKVLPPTAPVALITLTDTGSQVTELSLDRRRLRRLASRLQPTFRTALAAEGVQRAQRLLQEAPAGKPRAVYLVTDLTRVSLPVPVKLDPNVALQVVDVARRRLPNRGVVGLRTERARGPQKTRAFEVQVRNATDRAAQGVRVTLRAGGVQVATGTLDIPSHRVGKVTLRVAQKSLPAKARFVTASVESDRLAGDDERAIALQRGAKLRVLLVDGDPRETRHDDEIFYLEAALRALSAGRLRLSVQVVAGGDLDSVALDGVDLVFFANVGFVSRRAVKGLSGFVRRGGGLVISLGSQVSPAYYNQVLGPALLPGRLRSIRAGGISGALGTPGRFSLADGDPGVIRALADPATRKALLASPVSRHGLVVPRGSEVLLRLRGGAPLLLERRPGRGRVLLWTTSVDRDWTDLPLRPAYLPLVRALVMRASGQGETASGPLVGVGQSVTLRPAAGDRGLVVRGPDGRLHRLTPTPGASASRAAVRFTATDVPGGYRVYSVGRSGALVELRGAAFAAVVPAAESDLRRLSRPPRQAGRLGAGQGGARPGVAVRRDLSAYFALLCLLLLLAETLLAARFGQWRLRRPRGGQAA